MIIGDEKLDRRELRDHADEPYDSTRCVRTYNQNGFPPAARKILFESVVTH
jgi:hypothetical protein